MDVTCICRPACVRVCPQVCLVSGETGCGKSTQVPQFLLDDPSIGPRCKMVCTQPRRISAIAVAERIAEERGDKIGAKVMCPPLLFEVCRVPRAADPMRCHCPKASLWAAPGSCTHVVLTRSQGLHRGYRDQVCWRRSLSSCRARCARVSMRRVRLGRLCAWVGHPVPDTSSVRDTQPWPSGVGGGRIDRSISTASRC